MSKPKLIDLTGNLSRLRQIAMNHAVDLVARRTQGQPAHEARACADGILDWLISDRSSDGQAGDGARYGVPAKNGETAVTPCRAWFSERQEAESYAVQQGLEVWDLVLAKRLL